METRSAVVAVVVATALAALVALGGPAAAEPSVSAGPRGDGVEVTDGRSGRTSSTPSTGRSRRPRRPVGPTLTFVLRPELRWDAAANRVCLHVGREPGDPSSTTTATREASLIALARRYPRCTVAPRRQPVREAAASPFGAASWRDLVTLPAPTLRFAPGAAVTGLPGCLEVGGPAAVRRDVTTPFGSVVRLQVTSTYDVDWGDGTARVTGTTERGGPCPDGRLRHTYRWRGTVTVTVVQRWRASWTTGNGRSERLSEELRTVGRLALPVREVQSVRTG